jgi:hypothetical protein
MADRGEVESVILADDNVLVAHTHSDPVRSALFDFESNVFDLSTFLQIWLHNCELVAGGILTFDHVICHKLNVVVLESVGKLV